MRPIRAQNRGVGWNCNGSHGDGGPRHPRIPERPGASFPRIIRHCKPPRQRASGRGTETELGQEQEEGRESERATGIERKKAGARIETDVVRFRRRKRSSLLGHSPLHRHRHRIASPSTPRHSVLRSNWWHR
ncbi:uncharacterized protein [Physcomitrium patens]|uniref:uncharacterized protein n=1 Tax=Physcomitrium patens TaxID=3218 RepID=UPI003CCD9D94